MQHSALSEGKPVLSEHTAPIESLADYLEDGRVHHEGSAWREPAPSELTVAAVESTDASGFKSRFPEAWAAIWSATDLKTWQKEAAEDAIELAIEVAADPVFQENLVANLQLAAGFFVEAIKRDPLKIAKTATESVGVSVAKGVTITIAANLVADALLQAQMFETMDASTKAALHGLVVGTVSVGIQTVDDFRTGGIHAAVGKGAARRIVDMVEIYFAATSAIAEQDRALLAVVQSLEVSVNLETSVATDRARTIADENVQASLALVPGIVGVDDAKAVDKLLRMARDALRLQAEGKPDAAGKLARELHTAGRLENNIRPWSALTNPLDYLAGALRRDRDIGKDAPARTAEIIIRTTRLSELFAGHSEPGPLAGSDGAERLRAALQRDLSPAAIDENGWTDLHYAAAMNLPNAVGVLVQAGAGINAPLPSDHRVVLGGHLLELNPKSIPTNYGQSPLHVAAQFDAIDAARELLDRGAEIHARDELNMTPLHYAAWDGTHQVLTELLNRGAEVNEKATDGWTALHFAASVGDQESVERLIEHGAGIDDTVTGGETPLHFAVRQLGLSESDYPLLEDVSPETALATVRALIAHGANVRLRDDEGRTPLELAEEIIDGQSLLSQVRESFQEGFVKQFGDLDELKLLTMLRESPVATLRHIEKEGVRLRMRLGSVSTTTHGGSTYFRTVNYAYRPTRGKIELHDRPNSLYPNHNIHCLFDSASSLPDDGSKGFLVSGRLAGLNKIRYGGNELIMFCEVVK